MYNAFEVFWISYSPEVDEREDIEFIKRNYLSSKITYVENDVDGPNVQL